VPRAPRPRRVLRAPRAARSGQADGRPFIFFDQMGPAEFLIGSVSTCARIPTSGSQPHLSFRRRRIVHRDSLGAALRSSRAKPEPACRRARIVHAERTVPSSAPRGRACLAYSLRRRCRSRTRKAPLRLPITTRASCRACRRRKTVAHHGDALRRNLSRRISIIPRLARPFWRRAPVPAADPDHDDAAGGSSRHGEINIAGRDVVKATGAALVFRPATDLDTRGVAGAASCCSAARPMTGRATFWWNFVSSSKAASAAKAMGRPTAKACRTTRGVHPVAG